MIDEALGSTLAMDPPFLSSALCLPDFGGVGGATCPSSAVRELLVSTPFILTRLRSRPLVFGTSFSCLPSLWERLHLQPAPSRPLSPKDLNYLPSVDKRLWITIEGHRS